MSAALRAALCVCLAVSAEAMRTGTPTVPPTHAPTDSAVPTAVPTPTCYPYSVFLSDAFGDGWQGNKLHVGDFQFTLSGTGRDSAFGCWDVLS